MFLLKVICILCSVHFIGLFIFERLQRSNGNRSAIKINVVGKANDMDIILFLLNNFRFRHWKDVLIFLELCWDWRGPILTLHYLGYTVTNKTVTHLKTIFVYQIIQSDWCSLSMESLVGVAARHLYICQLFPVKGRLQTNQSLSRRNPSPALCLVAFLYQLLTFLWPMNTETFLNIYILNITSFM